MKTLAETRSLCRGDEGHDPLYATGSTEAEARVQDLGASLYLQGHASGGDYADDLLITPTETGWRLQYRDPEGLGEPSRVHGREWVDGGHYTLWDDLVGFAYSL